MEDISQAQPPQPQEQQNQQNQHEAAEESRQEEQAPRHGSYESSSTSPTRSTASDSVMSTAPSTPELRPEDGDGGAETPKMTTRQPPPPQQHFTPHDSLVTVRLSEPPALTLDTSVGQQSPPPRRVSEPEMGQMLVGPEEREETNRKAEQAKEEAITEEQGEDDDPVAPDTPTDARRASAMSKSSDGPRQSLEDELREEEEKGEPVAVVADGETPEGRPASLDASDEEVDWDELQKSEDRETKTEDTDNSTAMLLARLEQENAKLATNPKMAKVRAVDRIAKSTRPPSMAQLRSMVSGPTPAALRYSMIPPPPMTDLEFYAALVKDYEQTASRLPTLLSNKIRKGIPPPLRGVVWQSMSGARDGHLEDQYERLSGETSPHEPVIIKDLGRSFPGVDMFRDPAGDGQRMLGRVLKCYSIYDPKIGYCQGLAFLVGPLLMHMPDKAAFCVLVRLMERYDLRSCFLPDLPGLHTRIYQFRELLRQMLPGLSSHLDDLQADPAYVSQWFLSFFAVTAPLPMLFRIYDVVFAEGASESLMRVALCLMRKNQGRLLACTELEDAMQLLLSRGLWDCYHYNADEFVRDFVSLTGVVSRDKLKQLEREFREEGQQQQQATSGAARASAVTSAASRFLGRIWASSSSATASASLSSSSSSASSASPRPASTLSPTAHAPPPPPPSQPPRPFSMLRRTTSKQSLASTLNSLEASSSSVVSSVASTAATSRDSSSGPDAPSAVPAAATAPGHGAKHTEEKYLHSQIEDLLTALSELQRDQALLADDLQREREEREDDRRAMQRLLGKLRREGVRGGLTSTSTSAGADAGDQTTREEQAKEGQPEPKETEAETSIQQHTEGGLWISSPSSPSPDRALSDVIAMMERRFGTDLEPRPSSGGQSKTQLRSELARTHQQLETAASQTQDLNRKVYDFEQTVNGLKDQLRESHVHIRSLHQDKQRLEKQVRTMRVRASAASEHSTLDGGAGGRDDWHGSGSGPGAGGGAAPAAVASTSGLRELKLGRSRSTPNQTSPFARRGSAMARNAESTLGVPAGPGPPESGGGAPPPPAHEADALLLELVQAKTAEAVAKQEAEEAKQKLENLRKALGISAAAAGDQQQQQQYHGQHHHHSSSSAAAGTVSSAASAAMGVFGRLTGSGQATTIESGAIVSNSNNNNRPATANSTSSAVTMMMTTAVGPTSSPSNGASKPTPSVGSGTAAAGGGFWGGWRRS